MLLKTMKIFETQASWKNTLLLRTKLFSSLIQKRAHYTLSWQLGAEPFSLLEKKRVDLSFVRYCTLIKLS